MKIIEKPSEGEICSMSAEHAALAKQQYEALQKSPYVKMTQAEADAYDKRRLRIGELCELLAVLRSSRGSFSGAWEFSKGTRPSGFALVAFTTSYFAGKIPNGSR